MIMAPGCCRSARLQARSKPAARRRGSGRPRLGRAAAGLKQAIQADFASAWFMYGILIMLVAFSVLNTQLMSVLERTKEFGIVMSLG